MQIKTIMEENYITYIYRGQIEVGCLKNGKHSYRWANGYSEQYEDRATYPAQTREACRQDARLRGCKAIFIMSGE